MRTYFLAISTQNTMHIFTVPALPADPTIKTAWTLTRRCILLLIVTSPSSSWHDHNDHITFVLVTTTIVFRVTPLWHTRAMNTRMTTHGVSLLPSPSWTHQHPLHQPHDCHNNLPHHRPRRDRRAFETQTRHKAYALLIATTECAALSTGRRVNTCTETCCVLEADG